MRSWFRKKGFSYQLENSIVIFSCMICTVVPLILYAFQINNGGHQWKTGDWLINYSGGLIRRGLFGEIVLRLADLTGLSPLWIVYTAQASIALVNAYLIIRLYYVAKRPTESLLLLFSPAFLFLFPLFDSGAGLRKEILGFLALLLLIFGLHKSSLRITLSSIIIYCFSVLSHELNCLMLPAFLYFIHRHQKLIHSTSLPATKYKSNSHLKPLILPYSYLTWTFLLISICGLIFSVLFPGTTVQQVTICNQLIDSGIPSTICEGAISWIGRTATDEFLLVYDTLPEPILLYSLHLIISLIPFVLLRAYGLTGLRTIFILALAVFILPLFLIGKDWGRWIHIYITLITCIFLYEDSIKHSFEKYSYLIFPKYIFILVLCLNISWTIVGFIHSPLRFGIWTIIHQVIVILIDS